MKRLDKVNKIKKIKDYLDKIPKLSENPEEVNLIKNEYQKLKEGEVPILLFVIDNYLVGEYVEVPGQDMYYQYKYVYYYPDVSRVDTYYSFTNTEVMEGALNYLDITREYYQEYLKGNLNFLEMVNNATRVVNEKIDNILSLNNIKDWEEARKYLEILGEEKDSTMVR